MADAWQVAGALGSIAVAILIYVQIHLDHLRGRPGVKIEYAGGEFLAYATKKPIESAAVMFEARGGRATSSASMVDGKPVGQTIIPGGEPARAFIARGFKEGPTDVLVSGSNIRARRFHYYLRPGGEPVRLRGPRPWRWWRCRMLKRGAHRQAAMT